jgi:hypothetical protein
VHLKSVLAITLKLFFGKNAFPFIKHPKVLAPVWVALGKSDNWSTGCFLQKMNNREKLKMADIKNMKFFTTGLFGYLKIQIIHERANALEKNNEASGDFTLYVRQTLQGR